VGEVQDGGVGVGDRGHDGDCKVGGEHGEPSSVGVTVRASRRG
jgi:hypothetical protein